MIGWQASRPTHSQTYRQRDRETDKKYRQTERQKKQVQAWIMDNDKQTTKLNSVKQSLWSFILCPLANGTDWWWQNWPRWKTPAQKEMRTNKQQQMKKQKREGQKPRQASKARIQGNTYHDWTWKEETQIHQHCQRNKPEWTQRKWKAKGNKWNPKIKEQER